MQRRGKACPFPRTPLPASGVRPSLRSGQVSLDEAEHFPAQSSCQRRYAPMVFGIIPECRSASFRNKRSASPESPRRDKLRMVVDGITAANDLGLTDSVPARAVVLTDSRLVPIKLGNLTIHFKRVEPSRLYWAGRPAMRVVQALHWLRDMLPADRGRILNRLLAMLRDPNRGKAIQDDLSSGLSALPEWLQDIVRDLLHKASAHSDLTNIEGNL